MQRMSSLAHALFIQTSRELTDEVKQLLPGEKHLKDPFTTAPGQLWFYLLSVFTVLFS